MSAVEEEVEIRGSAEKRSVSFPADLWKWVEDQAAEESRKVSGYLQELVREARKRKLQETAELPLASK